jgi:hypothetical protein
MGAFFTSFSIPGDVHEAVDQKIREWLSRKGFQEPPDPVLDHTKEGERAYYLFWNDRWTIVLFSHFEEEERLLFELRNDDRPVLHLWLHDSDLWGYELYLKNRSLAAFNSNPKYFGAYEEPAAPNDIPLLMKQCSIRGLTVSEMEGLQKKKGIFKENACETFAKAIGIGPAASQYGYHSEAEPAAPDFSVVHRRYRKRGFDPMRNFNLHVEPAKSPQEEMPISSKMPALPPGFRVLMEIMRVMAIPIGWLFRIILAIKMKTAEVPGLTHGTGASPVPKEYALEGGWLVNPKRRCRIKFSEGAAPSEAAAMLPFKIQGKEVFSRTMSADETRHMLTGLHRGPIEEEENYWIGSLAAKRIRLQAFPRQDRFRYLYFIQASVAVYYFSLESKGPLEPAEYETLKKTIGSFEVVHPAQAG